MTTRPTFVVHLAAGPDRLDRDPVIRLRAALKSLRCLHVEQVAAVPDAEPAATVSKAGGAG